MRLYVLIAASILAAACGGSSSGPLAPTPQPQAPLSLTGTWGGSLAMTVDGATGISALTLGQLTQNGLSVTGMVRCRNGTSAEITGTLSSTDADASTFSGTMRLTTLGTVGGTFCHGSAHISGPARRQGMTWTAATASFDNCTGTVSDLRLEIVR